MQLSQERTIQMKETDLRNKVLAGIIKYNGVKQGSVGHKEILKIFNDSGLCSRYTMTVNDPWCATTASAAYIKAGLAGKGKIFPCVECSCSRMIQLAKDAGIWQEKDDYMPKVADLILYDWDDNGVGDNTGAPEHVGIVAAVDGSVVKVFEGHTRIYHSRLRLNRRQRARRKGARHYRLQKGR